MLTSEVVFVASVLELVRKTEVREEGSLEVRELELEELEVEASLLHHREGFKAASKAGVPGQMMAYEGQIKIAETLQALAGAPFPEIFGAKALSSDWAEEHVSYRFADARARRWFERQGYRYYVATALDLYKEPMPISCLESYEAARALGVFDRFTVWERAMNESDASNRVWSPTSSFPRVEADPYLVGVVTFSIPDRVNLSDGGKINRSVSVAPSRFFLIDRWDEIDPMP